MSEPISPLFGDDPAATAPAKYPSTPGWKARDTAEAAAHAAKPRAREMRDRVLAELKRCPMSADEVAASLKISPLYARPRLSELAADALIKDSGTRRPNASGKSAIVWMAA